MLDERWAGCRVLYVCPLRALLNNLEPRLERYCARWSAGARPCGTATSATAARRRILADPPDCLLTTPESLEAMFRLAGVDHRASVRGVRAVVVDEVHAFAATTAAGTCWRSCERLAAACRPGAPADRAVGDGRQPGGAAELAVRGAVGERRGRTPRTPELRERRRSSSTTSARSRTRPR